MTKSLIEKAINIKGKNYVLVSDRVIFFNENYPNWSIETERLSDWEREIIKATITPDCDKPNRKFTWYSQATWGDWFINKTSALENCETSAVGRALAMMWIWVIDSIASIDEINKANNTQKVEKPEFKESDYKELEALISMSTKTQIQNYIQDLNKKYSISDWYKNKIKDLYNKIN